MDDLLQDLRYNFRRLIKSLGFSLIVVITLALAGVGLGLNAALVLTRVIASQLYEVRPTDPATFLLVASLLTAVALAANLIPTLRATRVDPAVVLRDE